MIELAITIAVVAILGIITFFLVGRKPKFFWPFLIALPLIASGFMIAGRAVVDEYFLAAVIAGGFLAAGRSLVSSRTGEKNSLHVWVFLFTVVYFVLQSVRGAIALEDIKILRWVGYFVLFGALLFLVRRWRFPFPSAILTAKITGIASSVYFGAYFILGFVSECALGIFRWVPQGVLWAGSAYAVFPVIFSFPAAIFLLKTEDRKARRLGWLTLFLSVLTVGFYESRIGWLALFGMLLFVPLVLGFRRALRVAPGLLIVFGFTFLFTLSAIATPYWLDGQQFREPYCHTALTGKASLTDVRDRLFNAEWYKIRSNAFWDGISATAFFPIAPRVSDIDRMLHFKAGFLASSETPLRFLFGGGTHSHRSILWAPLQELYEVELPGVEISPVVRTIGLSAILVDFGLIGFALIILNLFFIMKAFLKGHPLLNGGRASILLVAIILVPLWLSVSDIQDMVIYFLLLMPENVFTLLMRDS